jgi:hypothetical protein
MSLNLALGLIVTLPLLAGLLLIKQGWWPQRRGDEPYCRPCGYLLVGLNSQRCPECGAMLSSANIVHGRRHSRHLLGSAGLALLLLGLAVLGTWLAGELSEINWYQFKPTFLVIRDLGSSSASVNNPAIVELIRRDQANNLSLKYELQIADIALAEQATTNQTQLTNQLISFLESQYFAGHLTDSQKTRFGQQALRLTLNVRPIVVLGYDVPFVIENHCRVTAAPFWVRTTGTDSEATLDGKKIHGLSGSSSTTAGLGSSSSTASTFRCSTVGKHLFVQSVHAELHTGTFDSNDPKNLVFQQICTLSAPFEIVAQPPTGDFTIIDDPTLHNPIQSKIYPRRFTIGLHNGYLQGDVKIDSPPADLAFEAIGRLGDRQISLGSIVCKNGTNVDYGIGGFAKNLLPGSQPAAIDLILRSSEKVGHQTIDLHDMWKGEIIFSNVPLQIDPNQ